ncbi:MAG: hypothetical protein ACRD23_09780 [Terriglobales bacterium]
MFAWEESVWYEGRGNWAQVQAASAYNVAPGDSSAYELLSVSAAGRLATCRRQPP